MYSQARSLSSLFRAVSFAAIATLVMAVALDPVWAQDSVPPTAVQAAKMPQFASRLAHPAKRPAPPISPALARARNRRGPLDSNDIYDNGPTNGNTDAWTINFGFVVSDSFNVSYDNTLITGGSFAMWLFPGDTLTSAELSITSEENGGTSYFDQTVNFTQSGCVTNEFGYNVCTETTSFTGPNLNAGTYWVNLQNASIPNGDPIYWDENSGPSSASQNSVGTIPSESFTILGSATTTSTTYENNYSCPGPQSGFHDLREFSNGASSVGVDTAGNLYGSFGGGSYGAGQLYELAQRVGHWFLTSLYSFLGGSNGSNPGGVIVGPERVLYGAASGGIQMCGSDGSSYCGLIYEARPAPTACATTMCGWNEATIYQFTGNTDAWGGTVTAFDSASNLYGISPNGANGVGAVFELTPSSRSWTEKILYSFTGQNDGGSPNSLLVGRDGNLYGTAGGGQYGYGVVFQLVPSGGGWTENVLYSFTGTTDGYSPGGLIQDRSGDLIGFDTCYHYGYFDCSRDFYDDPYGLVFALSPNGGGWEFGILYNNNGDCDTLDNFIHGLAIDANGNLYVAEGGTHEDCDPSGCQVYNCGNVMSVYPRNYLVSGHADIFYNLTSDANGNLYGTTGTCGFATPQRRDGMIWQYSP